MTILNKSTFTADQLYEGMSVNVIDSLRGGKPMRATITRVHKCEARYYVDGEQPEGAYAYQTYRILGGAHERLFRCSDDDHPATSRCSETRACIHVRYRNNASAVVVLWAIRPANPLRLLAEQGQ